LNARREREIKREVRDITAASGQSYNCVATKTKFPETSSSPPALWTREREVEEAQTDRETN
jgi:hypothetical protein